MIKCPTSSSKTFFLIFQRNRTGLIGHGTQFLVTKIDFKEEETSRNCIPQSPAVSECPGANVMTVLPPVTLSLCGTVFQDKMIHLFVLVRRALGIFSW